MVLLEAAKEVVKTRERWLNQAREAERKVRLLPIEILALPGSVDGDFEGNLAVSVYYNKDSCPKVLEICKMAGVTGLSPTMISPNNWYASGKIALSDGSIASVRVGSLPKPPACIIEEYTETVTRYKAICGETGKEI